MIEPYSAARGTLAPRTQSSALQSNKRQARPKGWWATVLVADAVGFTHAMSLDEIGTLVALEESRATIRDAAAIGGGRIFSIKGDSVLVEY